MSEVIELDHDRVVDIDLFGDVKRKPGKILEEWSKSAPFYVMVAGQPQAVITRYAEQAAGLEDIARFSSVKRPWPGTEKFYYYRGLPVITDSDPPAQVRLRRLMAPAFSARRLIAIEANVKNFVAERLDKIAASGGEFDAVSDLGHPLAAFILLGQCLGLDPEIWPVFLRIVREMASFNTLPPGAPPPPNYLLAWDEGYAYCTALIEERRRNPKDDVIGKIVAAGDEEGKVSTDEMFATMLVLFTAGIGGIHNTYAFTLWRLCRDPSQLKQLQADPALVQSAIAESLRMDNNAWCVIRFATQNFEYGGLQIFENMPIYFMLQAPNYDPDAYQDPQYFDITRKPPERLSFGHGFHHCIGATLAKMAARIAVQQTVAKFPGLRLDDLDFFPDIVGAPKERGMRSLILKV